METTSHMLGLSLRQVASLVGYSSLYEFEDFIQAHSPTAHLLEISDYSDFETARRVYKALQRLDKTGSLGDFVSNRVLPKSSQFQINGDYLLFLPTFNNPFELFTLKAVDGWRRHCQYAACYINEVWASELTSCQYLMELIKQFDHIFVGLHHCVEEVAAITGKPCTYLPIGIDALKFSPYPAMPARNIDVCNIGRRSDITHNALLTLEQQRSFYYYDTISSRSVVNAEKQSTFHVKSHREHRLLLANLLKRSRYFIANRAFVNDPKRTGGNGEIPSRFFEGAAAGTVMLGEPPKTNVFKEYFSWPDAIIEIPFDEPSIADVIAELDANPARVEAIRRNNMVHAIQQHDWLHRLQLIYNALGLAPTEAMLHRAALLEELVYQVENATVFLAVAS